MVAALSMPTIAESEHARSETFDSPESVYRACADLKLFNQEVLRVLLLDTRQRLITMIDVTKGGLNESLGVPARYLSPGYRPFGLLFHPGTQSSFRRPESERS